jgi:hypothetical protein
MIGTSLALLIGIWDGFAGVFYDHTHPMRRSYALGHSLGRRTSAVRLWPFRTRGLGPPVATERAAPQNPVPLPPILTHSVRLVPEMRQSRPIPEPADGAMSSLAQCDPAEQVTENSLHNLHTSRPE